MTGHWREGALCQFTMYVLSSKFKESPSDIFSRKVSRYIADFKREESDFLLKFLYDHVALSQDLQARIKWAPGTVVVWDVSLKQNILLYRG